MSGYIMLLAPFFPDALHACPHKIFSGLIQPIPHAFPMDEEGKPARSLNH